MSAQRLSFHRYLVRPAVLAIVLTLWAALFIVTWAMYQQFRSLLIEQGVQIGEQFAQRGATLLLVEDPTLTRQTLDVFRNFPGVRYLAVLDRGFNVRIEEGLKRFTPGELSEPVPSARLSNENKECWQFIAPMRTIKSPSALPSGEDQEALELLGYVLVDIDKTSLRSFITTLGPLNGFIGIVLALIVVAWAKHDALKLRTAYLEAEIAVRLQEIIATRDRLFAQQERRAEFLATVTHEMRTPLPSILANVQLALEEVDVYEEKPDPARLRVILTSVQQLLALVNHMLDAQKLEPGRMELNLESVRLDELVREAVNTVMPYMRANNNRLEQVINTGPPVLIDREKLLQVLLNLLSNAGKYTQDGLVSLEMHQSGTELRIVVKDTGVGIPEDKLLQIFDWYRKVDTTDARRYQSTGLGLAISKGYCELMEGRISVESTLGSGSTFTVVIALPSPTTRGSTSTPPG